MHNIHQNNQTQFMSFVYQRFKVIRCPKAAARSEKVCHMIPALHVAKSHSYSSAEEQIITGMRWMIGK